MDGFVVCRPAGGRLAHLHLPGWRNTYPYTHGHSNTYSNAHRYSDGHSYSYSNARTQDCADTEASSDSAAPTVVLAIGDK